ncbi:glycosyltransferase family 32 protein [Pseudobutyrivibrio ruminis]|uniref:glycosyltransferase family 32 protein n=1 Tax=Pseudobutyrivibrio ruminis TaxID=46206 RepID=UPI001FA72303|nr:glycosyltransferase [Pseudobutyrivibrio ruminis]
MKEKRIVCFGAGRAAQNFFEWYKDELIVDRVNYILDNNSAKWGQVLSITTGRNIIIQSPKYLERDILNIDTIIITNLTPEPIIEQLMRIFNDIDFDVILYQNLKNILFENRMHTAIIPNNIRVTKEPLIPKVIHYCWFGGKTLPEKYREWMASWRKYCPDYEIIEWNESNYDFKKNQYMYDAYKAGKWGFVSDYARLDIIYNHGGIYLDTDVEVVKNLDDFLYHEGFAGFQPDGRLATGLGFGAVAGLGIIRELRDEYDNYEYIDFSSRKEINSKQIKPCPTLQTDYLLNKGLIFKNAVECIDGLYIYPAPVLCGKATANSKPMIDERTYTIHHFEGSWVNSLKDE